MSELGPYFPHQQGNALKSNPYAWNNGLVGLRSGDLVIW
jgi:hypothetical protein